LELERLRVVDSTNLAANVKADNWAADISLYSADDDDDDVEDDEAPGYSVQGFFMGTESVMGSLSLSCPPSPLLLVFLVAMMNFVFPAGSTLLMVPPRCLPTVRRTTKKTTSLRYFLLLMRSAMSLMLLHFP
jgi:hypothetical protein